MEWISVKDQMPEYMADVLLWCVSRGGRNTAHENGEGYCAVDRYLGRCFCSDGLYNAIVTHWMPIPEPPDTSNVDLRPQS